MASIRSRCGQDAGTVGRGVQRHDELGSPLAEAADRSRGAPRVLADGHADAHASDGEEAVPLLARGEIPPLVEHPVVREQLLADDRAHDARRTDGSGVVQVPVLLDKADHRRATLARGRDLLEREEVAGHKARLQEQVLRRIAGEHELGEHRELRARRLGPGELGDDLLGVAVEIADGGIQLAKCHAQCWS